MLCKLKYIIPKYIINGIAEFLLARFNFKSQMMVLIKARLIVNNLSLDTKRLCEQWTRYTNRF